MVGSSTPQVWGGVGGTDQSYQRPFLLYLEIAGGAIDDRVLADVAEAGGSIFGKDEVTQARWIAIGIALGATARHGAAIGRANKETVGEENARAW